MPAKTTREAAMAGRPVDYQRRAELLDALVDYAIERGFSELSWRPIACALGVSPTTLVHHFGSKEQMIEAILGRLRERMFAATAGRAGEQPDLATAARAVWDRVSDPRQSAVVLRGLRASAPGPGAVRRVPRPGRRRLDGRPV
jgi:AcrR family transcriptional regulator